VDDFQRFGAAAAGLEVDDSRTLIPIEDQIDDAD
jgi:hypothetical protein